MLSEQYRLAFEERYIPEPNSGCWIWVGTKKHDSDYGMFRYNNKNVRAHRLAWMIYKSQIPDGMHVLHRCDNPCCVNPDHLWLGTQAENNKDRDIKGRTKGPRGTAAHLAKLTDTDILKIREMAKNKHNTRKFLAWCYEVDKSTIDRILDRKTWTHV